MYPRTYRRSRSDSLNWALITIAAVVVIIIGVTAFSSYQHQHTRVTMVCSKERAATKSGAEYRIYTDTGTFVMKDILIGGTRFNTADAYGKIHDNTVYTITYKGWRFGPLSMFPNIIKAEPAPEGVQSSGGGC